MFLLTNLSQIPYTLISHIPHLLLLLLTKTLLTTLFRYLYQARTSDLHSIPSPPLPFWKTYTIGHNLIRKILIQDAFQTARLFNHWRAIHGPIYQLRTLLGERCVFITSASAIRTVNISQANSFVKPDTSRDALAALVGENGIMFAEGQKHARIRRAVAPAMHHRAVIAVGDVFVEQGAALARRLGKMGDSAGDVLREVRVATFESIFQTCFGKGRVDDTTIDALQEAYFAVFLQPSKSLVLRIILQKLLPFMGREHFVYRKDLHDYIRGTIFKLCKEHVRQCEMGEGRADTPLLAMMVDEGTDKLLANEEMLDTVLSFLAAGQLTTSMAVCWILYLLGQHTNWQRRVREEVGRWAEEDGLEGLDRMEVLDSVVREALRLYPSVFFVTRETKRTVVVDGLRIPAGVTVRLPVLAVQRCEEVWGSDAGEFRPERWEGGRGEKMRMFWCLFAFGPRSCIGRRFAMLQMKAFVAMVVRRVEVWVDVGKDGIPSCVGPFATPKDLKLYFRERWASG